MRTPCVGLVMVACVLGNSLVSIVSATESLTVERTPPILKGGWADVPSREQVHARLRLVNPGAREDLYRILGDPKQSYNWAVSVKYLAYITGPEDVARLREFIFSQKGLLSEERYRAIIKVFFVLSTMALRGIAEARDEVWKMVRPTYWRNADFSLAKSWWGKPAPVPIELAGTALVMYVIEERSTDAERLIEEVANMPGSDDEKNGLAPFVEEARQRLENAAENAKVQKERFAGDLKTQREAGTRAKSDWSSWLLVGLGIIVGAGLVAAGQVFRILFRRIRAMPRKTSALAEFAPGPPLEPGEKKP